MTGRGRSDGRPYGLIAVLVGLVVLLGVGLAIAAAERPPAGSARPPAPPPDGEHGDVRYQAVAGQGAVRIDLRVAGDGAFRIESREPGSQVDRSGRLSEADRDALAALVGATCRERLLAEYLGDVGDGINTTVTLCGLTVTLFADPDSAPPELDDLLAALWRLSRRLSGWS